MSNVPPKTHFMVYFGRGNRRTLCDEPRAKKRSYDLENVTCRRCLVRASDIVSDHLREKRYEQE